MIIIILTYALIAISGIFPRSKADNVEGSATSTLEALQPSPAPHFPKLKLVSWPACWSAGTHLGPTLWIQYEHAKILGRPVKSKSRKCHHRPIWCHFRWIGSHQVRFHFIKKHYKIDSWIHDKYAIINQENSKTFQKRFRKGQKTKKLCVDQNQHHI